MIEVTGNLWTHNASVVVITTNGTIKKNGTCVMGRGCAAEAKSLYPGIDRTLGTLIAQKGNIPHILVSRPDVFVVSMPVKHNWWERADLSLIRDSIARLVELADILRWDVVVMPRPGCGNGGLRWCGCINAEGESCEGVKHTLAPILDDRFHVITFGRVR